MSPGVLQAFLRYHLTPGQAAFSSTGMPGILLKKILAARTLKSF
ncbi:hypothetical protein ACFVJI_06915 [Streptomyces sp. NPDC127584]